MPIVSQVEIRAICPLVIKGACMPMLKVRKLDSDDANGDVVRIPKDHREGLPRNTMIMLRAGDKSKRLYVLGSDEDEPCIFMDLATRNYFGVHAGNQVQFTIRKSRLGGTLLWSIFHINPALRIASQLGVISLVLGIVSIIPLVVDYGNKLYHWIAPS
jgi:hypothetical protein